MDIGVFIPIGNNGWLISTNSPQYMPTFELNKQQYAERKKKKQKNAAGRQRNALFLHQRLERFERLERLELGAVRSLALSKSIAYQNSRGLHCLRRSPQANLTSQPKPRGCSCVKVKSP